MGEVEPKWVDVYQGDRFLGRMSWEQYQDSQAIAHVVAEFMETARGRVDAELQSMDRRPYDSHLRCPHCGKRMIVETVVRRGEEDLVHVCWTCSYEEVP